MNTVLQGTSSFAEVGHEGQVLLIRNISRVCADTYECVANNTVPPARTRQIKVTVQCKSVVFQFQFNRHLCNSSENVYKLPIRFHYIMRKNVKKHEVFLCRYSYSQYHSYSQYQCFFLQKGFLQ